MAPNILLVITDDQRSQPDGAGNVLTDLMPSTMAEFETRGRYFPNFYITSPVCAPSRATIYSGLYASQHGTHLVDAEHAENWNPFFSFQRQLQSSGYYTGIIGKYNNFLNVLTAPYFDFRARTDQDADEMAAMVTAVTDFLAAASDPWFLALSTNAPHVPYNLTPISPVVVPTFTAPTAAFESDLSDKPPGVGNVSATTRDTAESHFIGQMNECAALDEAIGDVFALFSEAERDAMLEIFVSDNGFEWAEHGLQSKQYPYTESGNVPCYVAWVDGGVGQGTTDNRLVANLDLAPTILDAADVTSDYAMPGFSLLAATTRPWLYCEMPTSPGAVHPSWRAYRTTSRLYIDYLSLSHAEDYNLTTDPTEESASNTADPVILAELDAVDLTPPAEPMTEAATVDSVLVLDPTIPVGDPSLHLELDPRNSMVDLSGRNGNRDGTAFGGLEPGDATDAPPGLNGSTIFDGISAYIEIVDYIPSTNVSVISAWVRREATGAVHSIFNLSGFTLSWNSTDVLRLLNPDNEALLFDPGTDGLNTWHLVTCEIDLVNMAASVFFDGVQVGTTQTILDSALGTPNFFIGTNAQASSFWAGKMARFTLHTHLLSDGEHLSSYERGASALHKRFELNIGDWVRYEGIDWGDSAIEQYQAEQSVGSIPVASRMPNRQIRVPMNFKDLGEFWTSERIRSEVLAKVGLFQQEGGSLRRGPVANPLFADIVNASFTLPDNWIEENVGINPEPVLTLECLPDFYGHEQYKGLEASSSTSGETIFTAEEPEGDTPGRTRMMIKSASATARGSLLYAVRSRFRGTDDPMVIEGEDMTLAGGSTDTGDATASGAFKLRNALIGTTDLTIGTFTASHAGPHRVWARVQTPHTGVSMWLEWTTGASAVVTANPRVVLGTINKWLLVDLGEINPRSAVVGTQGWQGLLRAVGETTTRILNVDKLYVLPTSEGYGQIVSEGGFDAALYAGDEAELSTYGYWREVNDTFAPIPPRGDLPRLPAGRDVEILIKTTTGNAGLDEDLDAPHVRVLHRPSYLFVPR